MLFSKIVFKWIREEDDMITIVVPNVGIYISCTHTHSERERERERERKEREVGDRRKG